MACSRVGREQTQPGAEDLVSHEDLQRLVKHWSASRRVTVRNVCRSHEGREIFAVYISAPKNLARLEDVRKCTLELTTPTVQHAQLNDVTVSFASNTESSETITSVLIEGGGFGMEAAHVEGLIDLVERLISDEGIEIKEILEKNIVIVMPMINPDGRMLAIEEWKRTPLSAGTAGHGNRYGFTINRDLFSLTQPETQAVAAIRKNWGLVAVYDPHEDMALLGVSHDEVCWAPPYNDRPYPKAYDADIMRLVDELGAAIAEQWRKSGFNALFDRDGNNGLLPFIMGPLAGRVDMSMIQHGIPAVLTESARTPGTQLWADRVKQKSDASIAVLAKATAEQERFVAAVRHARSRVDETAENAGYILPCDGADREPLSRFVELLQEHEIAVYRVEDPYAAYVVPLRQPRAGVIRTLFSDETGAAEHLCPDYGVQAYDLRMRDLHEQDAFASQRLQPADPEPLRKGLRVTGNTMSKLLAIPNSYSGIVLVNRLLKEGCSVERLVTTGDSHAPAPGTFVISRSDLPVAEALGASLRVNLIGMREDAGKLMPVELPRLAMYAGEGIGHLNMDHLADIVWSLDALEFPFVRLDREALLGGRLEEMDVLIIPGGDGQAIIDGLDPRIVWHRPPWEAPTITGRGIGQRGVRIVRDFVAAGGRYFGIGMGGGWFATRDLSGLMAVDTAPSPLGSGTVYLDAVRTGESLLAGFCGIPQRNGEPVPARMVGYFYAPPFYFKEAGTSPLFVARDPARGIARYTKSLAPEAQDEASRQAYVGKDAIVTQTVGKGRATICGINVGFRANWYGTYPLLANAVFG